MNLLPRELTDEEIVKCITNIPELSLNIIEGGYVSDDFAVILVYNRRPYIGQLLQYKGNVEKETLDLWVNKICGILNISQVG